jgi:polyisoprenoid-binding protein YceI
MEIKTFEIVNAHSNIDWIGRKVTGAHNGTIALKEGSLTFVNGQLKSGKVIIDTTSIKILDVTDPATNAQFAGHLASDDFFNSAIYTEAELAITSSKRVSDKVHHIIGDLTIKGITHPISFDAQIDYTNDQLTAHGNIVIDRTRYGMRFRSGNFFKDLGDTLIYNEFEMNVSITAKAAVAVI